MGEAIRKKKCLQKLLRGLKNAGEREFISQNLETGNSALIKPVESCVVGHWCHHHCEAPATPRQG